MMRDKPVAAGQHEAVVPLTRRHQWFRPANVRRPWHHTGTAVGGLRRRYRADRPHPLAQLSSWRWVFFLTGAAGLCWTVWWLASYFPPEQHRGLRTVEGAMVESAPQGSVAAQPMIPIVALLRFRETWGIVAVKFLTDAAWYFYIFWLPKYLLAARADIRRHQSRDSAAAGVGCLEVDCRLASSSRTLQCGDRRARAPSCRGSRRLPLVPWCIAFGLAFLAPMVVCYYDAPTIFSERCRYRRGLAWAAPGRCVSTTGMYFRSRFQLRAGW
jgi:hypothetical protein